MLQLITAVRSAHVLVRIGFVLLAVAMVTALQLPADTEAPGKPFLLHFFIVALSAVFMGRVAGFFAVAATSIASGLYFEPAYSFKVRHAVDLALIEAYAVAAAVAVEGLCRLVDSALAERWERLEHQETQERLAATEDMARRLTESEARFRATFENAAVGISHFGADGHWIRVNDAMCRILGWSAEDLVTKSFTEISHPDDAAVELRYISQLSAGEIASYSLDKRSRRKDGGIVWIRRTVSCVRKDDGSVAYFVSVVEDISDRKRAEVLLQRQADLLDQSHDAIFTWKIGGGITYWSRGAEALYGYSREDAIGRVSHDLLQTRAQIPVLDIEAQIARQGSWYGELTHTTRDGREIIVGSRHVRVDYDGELYALETNRDITMHKRAEEKVQLLMHEANHRVKNMLGLVQAISRQTATGSPEHFVERFTEHLQALAANQDLLIRNNWEGVDAEDLLRGQLAHFADLIGSRIKGSGPKLRLNAGAAQAIGLAVHELATNASKYGALSTDCGHVDIAWRVEGDTFALSWIERGGPSVRPPEHRGFGGTIIDTMAKRAVDGEVDLDYAPTGLRWRLACPAANALEVEKNHNPLT